MKISAQKNVRRGFTPIRSGFTLIELLITIAIIAVLSAAVLVGINPVKKLQDARNAKRKSDLGQIATALNSYFITHSGQYPVTPTGLWCGIPSFYAANCGADWIPGLVSSGELAILPTDPLPNNAALADCNTGDRSGYLYRSNGSDYKIMAYCSPEGTLSATDPFYDPKYPGHSWQISTSGGTNW